MAAKQCMECGILDGNQTGQMQCLALKRALKKEDLNRFWDCYYFISVIVEDGDRFTPFEHYLLKLDEIEKEKVSVLSMATE